MTPTDRVECHPSWMQASPNTYTQPYGFQEVLYNAIAAPPGSPALFLIGTWATLSYTPSSPDNRLSVHELALRFRGAWLQMRLDYPTLAAEGRPEGKTYTAPTSSAELEQWLDETFIVAPGRTAVEHWNSMVKTRHMSLFFLPEERQLFLQGEHHTLDGRGTMNFWDRFFQALASQTKDNPIKLDGSEVSRLPPRSDDLLDMTEKKPGRAEQRAHELLEPLTSMESPIFLPAQHPLPPCSLRNAMLELKISTSATQSIIAACKAKGLSMTAAWHAAVVLATQTAQARRNEAMGAGAVAGAQFGCFGNFDLRRYFPAPGTGAGAPPLPDVYALNNHHCILPYVVTPGGKTFAQLCRELGAFYSQDVPRADPEVWSALGPMIRTMVPDFVKPQLDETTPALSSLGVVDSFIKSTYVDADGKGKWGIEHLWFGNTVMGPWFECFMWAWKGRLSFNICYNSAYYSHVEVEEFNQLVLEKMVEGLGVTSWSPGSKL
ncbi:hypothetical protein F5Y15DRAFT_33245 [Xylariaceae sp. FL0016]|nr:hypothetical protein F5Y15DRAFT_33245 [Xylariaceae sp. FL0016]